MHERGDTLLAFFWATLFSYISIYLNVVVRSIPFLILSCICKHRLHLPSVSDVLCQFCVSAMQCIEQSEHTPIKQLQFRHTNMAENK